MQTAQLPTTTHYLTIKLISDIHSFMQLDLFCILEKTLETEKYFFEPKALDEAICLHSLSDMSNEVAPETDK